MILILNPNQAEALFSLCGQANSDGDHYDWLKSANASAAELKACRDVMEITRDANEIAQRMKGTKR